MNAKEFIGIDPDTRQIVCALLKGSGDKPVMKTFEVTNSGLEEFIKWTDRLNDPVIVIEGSNGQSRPIEKALRASRKVFYSFKANDVARERQNHLGQGKNNELDALATAILAKNRANAGNLEKWKRVYPVDRELQSLTRYDDAILRKTNAEISQIWKEIREISPDLYLFLGGKHEEWEQEKNILDSAGVLNLLANYPDPSRWKRLDNEEMQKAMGGRNVRGRDELIELLRSVSKAIKPGTQGHMFLIREMAENILRYKRQRNELQKMIIETASSRETVLKFFDGLKTIHELKGISLVTVAKMAAEIVDIRRFAGNNNLAQYAGLGMVENETGKREKGRAPRLCRSSHYNRRLKNVLLVAAKNLVQWNKNHRLTGMFKDHLKKGMSYLEALKRVARALCRVIFKVMMSEKREQEMKTENIKNGEAVAKMGLTRRITSASNTCIPRNRITQKRGISQKNEVCALEFLT